VTAALIPLAGYPLLYLPIHIVWLELLIHPTAMLAFQDLPAAERLDRVARKRVRFFSLVVWMLIFGAGAIIAMAMIWGYDRGLGTERNVAHARAIAISVLVLASAALTLGLTRGGSRNAWGAVALTLASLALVQTPSLAGALHLQPLHVDDLWLAGAVSAGIAVWSVAVGRLLAR